MKKAKLLILLALLLIIMPFLHAVPAIPHPVTFTQPNGDTLTVKIKGDERIHWHESTDGYTLLFNKAGYLSYAQLDENGNLQPSNIIATSIENRNIVTHSFLNNIEPHLFYSDMQQQLMLKVWEIEDNMPPKSEKAVTGLYKTLCAFVQFPGKFMIKSMIEFEGLMNQLGYTANGTGSVRDFFKETSYNQFDLIVTLCGVYTAPNNQSYYAGNDGTQRCNELGRWLAQQVAAEPHINFSDYDSNNDGVVDGFHFIFAGVGQEAGGGSGTIWSHKWQFSPAVTKNGKSISVYSCSPELISGTTITTIGVICHEMSHAFGAADFYDTNGSTGGSYTGTGNWDIMANGSWNGSPGGNRPAHHNMYSKIKFGWVTPVVLNSAITITNMPNSAENPVAYRINTTTNNEYFLLENRQRIKFDTNIPGDGLLIYRVHAQIASAENNNTINTTHPQRMYPVCASATVALPTSTASSYGTINSAGCPFPGTSNQTSFTDSSTPSMRSWANANTNRPITNIVHANRLIRFDFMGGGSVTHTIAASAGANGTITPSGNITVNEGASQKFDFTANTGYHIDRVLINGANNPDAVAAGSYTFTNVTASHTISVTFAMNTYTVTLPDVAGVAVNAHSTSPVPYDGEFSFSLALDPAYSQSDIIVKANDIILTPASDVYTIANIKEDQAVTIEGVQLNTYTITASVNNANYGTISPNGIISIIHGNNQTFTIIPESGYYIDDVLVDNVSNSDAITDGAYTFFNIVNNHTIEANFAIYTYTVTLPNVTGATVTPHENSSSPVHYGGNFSFTITLNQAYSQSNIIVKVNDVILAPVSGVYTIVNITENKIVTIEGVQLNTYKITASTDGNGVIEPLGEITINYGENQIFNFMPNTGMYIEEVLIDGVNNPEAVIAGTYTFYNVTASHTIHVTSVCQTATTIIGTGGSKTYQLPVNTYYNRSYTQQIYEASEIGTFTDNVAITSISFQYFDGIPETKTDQTIYLGNTHKTVFANAEDWEPIAQLQQVFNGTIVYDPSELWLTVEFDEPFIYTGNNLVVAMLNNSGSYCLCVNATFHQDLGMTNKTLHYRADGTTPIDPAAPPTATGLISERNNIQLGICGTPIIYTITASAGANGTITPNGTINVDHGDSEAFDIEPNTGYRIDEVLIDGTNNPEAVSSGSYTFNNVTTNHTITASFTLSTYTVTLPTVTGATINPHSTSPVPYNGNFSFSIVLNPAYSQSNIIVKANDVILTPVSGVYTIVNITENQTVTIEGVQLNTYTITFPNITGITINATNPPVPYGGNCLFTIDLEPGYSHSNLFVKANDLVLLPQSGIYTIANIMENQIVTIEGVQLNTYMITSTVNDPDLGMIDPLGETAVEHGGSQTYIITPGIHTATFEIYVDGVAVPDADLEFIATPVTADLTIHVIFDPKTYMVNFDANGGTGTMEPQDFTYNEAQDLTANDFTRTGHTFEGWNTQADGNGTSYTDEQNIAIEEDMTLFAQWEMIPLQEFTITATAEGDGEITPEGEIVVFEGASQTFTLTPFTYGDCFISDVFVDGVSIGEFDRYGFDYVFENVNDNHTIHTIFVHLDGIVETLRATSLRIAPNPATDFIELRITNYELRINQIEFYNMFGQLVKTVPCEGENKDNTITQRISVADLSKGVYLIKVGNEMVKLVVQ